jgi:bifunctional non-homologous end joining protein LigD
VTRNGNPCESQYPELSALRHYVAAESAVLDGEIAVLDPQGRPSFELIQPRIHLTGAHTIANAARTNPVVYFAFDLLYLDGYDIRKSPLVARKSLLAAILKPSQVVRYSEHFEGSGEEFLEAARRNQLEGIVSKRGDSPYESRRSPNWLKTKIHSHQEFVICGYTKGERGGYFGALVLGLYEKGRLVWTGNVGTGFDQNMLEMVHALLQPLVTDVCPFADPPPVKDVTWVRPELVCEVKFSNWTEEGRLRAPVFLGLRNDLDPRECVREGTEADEQPAETSPASRIRTETLFPEGKSEVTLTIDGRRLKFTNLNKPYYPEDGVVKRDVIHYYNAVSDLILPYLRDRPLSLRRYPDGIHGESFFQKDAPPSFASWLRIEPVFSEHNQAPIRFVVADDRASLLYLANLGCIDQNPWMSRVGSLDNPDFILIDLDPQEGCEFARIVEAAQLVRRKLDLLELEGYPKTTGGRGLHIYVPIEPRYTYEQTRTFAEIIARVAASERPDLFTTPRAVARREKGKVYFDYVQNARGMTIAAPYVLRAYPGAPVATPLGWREVTAKLSPRQFHIRNAVDRFARAGDLFEDVLKKPQALEPAMEKLEGLVRALPR